MHKIKLPPTYQHPHHTLVFLTPQKNPVCPSLSAPQKWSRKESKWEGFTCSILIPDAPRIFYSRAHTQVPTQGTKRRPTVHSSGSPGMKRGVSPVPRGGCGGCRSDVYIAGCGEQDLGSVSGYWRYRNLGVHAVRCWGSESGVRMQWDSGGAGPGLCT